MDFLNDLTDYLKAGNAAVSLLKAAAGLLPKDSKETRALEEIERAETALRLSESTAAKALGYKLCQCTFPPQIMLWKEAESVYVCPNPSCGQKARRFPGTAGVVVTSPRGDGLGWMR